MEDILAVLIPYAAFAMAIIIVWLASREKVAKARLRAELQKELLAKFSSGQELAEFLNTDGSKLLMQDPSTSRWGSKERVIKLVSAGIIVLAVGGAFFFANTGREAAAILTAVGLGLLLSALVSHLLAKKMGLEDQSTGGRTSRS